MFYYINQAIGLVSYGNAFLAGLTGDVPPELWPSYDTFGNAPYLRFVRRRRSGGDLAAADVLATNTGEWFRTLKRAGATRLRLLQTNDQTPDYFSLVDTFGGPYACVIGTDAPDGEAWAHRLEGGGRAGGEGITYAGTVLHTPPPSRYPDVASALATLHTAIEAALPVVESLQLEDHRRQWSAALDIVTRPRAPGLWFPGARSNWYNPSASRLMIAAAHVIVVDDPPWVIIGDPSLYARWSAGVRPLYRAASDALIAATNAFGDEQLSLPMTGRDFI